MEHNHLAGLLIVHSISMPDFLRFLISSSAICHDKSSISTLLRVSYCFFNASRSPSSKACGPFPQVLVSILSPVSQQNACKSMNLFLYNFMFQTYCRLYSRLILDYIQSHLESSPKQASSGIRWLGLEAPLLPLLGLAHTLLGFAAA